MAIQQDKHVLEITTPLGEGVLLLGSFSGTEAISRLFNFKLQLISESDSVEANDIVGKSITWEVQYRDGPKRFFNGFVSRFAGGGLTPRKVRSYSAEVVPWLWFLTRTANCRIFQKKTAPEIIQKVFDDLGFKEKYELELKNTYVKREYCVQYRETAFNFVSRLMEEEGMFYFFRHEEGKHVLVLGDQKGSFKDLSTDPVNPAERIDTFEHHFEFRSGKYSLTDYNFETPATNLFANTNTILKLPDAPKYEIFDYPGDYSVKGDGKARTKVRMEEEEVAYEVVTATSKCNVFAPAGKFSLESHDVASEAGTSYVVTAIQHSAVEASFENTDAKPDYHNSFFCIPDTVPYRPARLTPKPVIAGVQPAVVVGPAGEEIYTDKYGRIKVQFFWDREGKKDENSTCWIRVAQVWAGKRWGASFWPRIGQEVIVDFLEGDPDQPIITGSVYNADQMPPYLGEGPDDKHKSDNKVSGIKSNTTKEGKGFNEWRFDDNKGKEEVFIHAERNMDTRVKNDRMELVLNDRHMIVGQEKDGKKTGDQKEKVFQDKHAHILRNQIEQIEGNHQFLVGKGKADDGGKVDISIEKDQKELIGGNYDLHVKGNQTAGVDGAQDLTVGGDKKEAVKGKSHLHVTGDFMEKVDGGLSLTVGADQQIKATGKFAVDAGPEIHLKAGTKVIIEAGTQVTLKVGGNFVDISSSGVTIVGTAVMINSGGAAGSGGGSSPTAPQDAKAVQDAKDAKPVDPLLADDSKSGSKSAPS